MVSRAQVQNDSVISPVVTGDIYVYTWTGHEKRILMYPVDFNQQFNITCTYPKELSGQKTSDSETAIGEDPPSNSDLFLRTYLSPDL